MSDDFIEMGEQIASDLDKIQQMVQKLLFELEDTPNLQKLRQVEDLIFSTRQKCEDIVAGDNPSAPVPYNYVAGPVADDKEARRLTSVLLQVVDDELAKGDEAGKPVRYVDMFMAVHNAHVRVVETIVVQSGDASWRLAAKATFERRMKEPGEYDTKVWSRLSTGPGIN